MNYMKLPELEAKDCAKLRKQYNMSFDIYQQFNIARFCTVFRTIQQLKTAPKDVFLHFMTAKLLFLTLRPFTVPHAV